MKIYAFREDGYEYQYFDEDFLKEMLAEEMEQRDFIWWLNTYYTPIQVYEKFYNDGYDMALLYFEKEYVKTTFQDFLDDEGYDLVINDEENYYND